MQTIVTLCGSGWNQWPSLVRTRALDLYCASESVEFWDTINPPAPDQAIWGNWPRHVTLGGPALTAEYEDLIARITGQDRLALLMVYPTPQALLTEPVTRHGLGPRPPLREDLAGLWRRGLAGQPTRALRVMRMAIFDCSPDPENVAVAASLIDDSIFDCVFFLADDSSGGLNASIRRRFNGIRLLIDIVRDGRKPDRPLAHDFWPDPLRPGAGKSVPVYVMRVPAEAPSQDPSTRRAAEIVFYFDRHTAERGQDSVGQSLKDLQAVEQKIETKIAVAREMLPQTSITRMSEGPDAGLEVSTQQLMGKRLLIADKPPDDLSLHEVDHWRRSILDSLTTFLNERRSLIRDRQTSTDASSRKTEDDIDASMQSAISAHQTGLTGNALSWVTRILKRVREVRAELATGCAATRDEIFNRIARESRDDGEVRRAPSDHIRALPEFEELIAMHRDFRITTANTVQLRRYALGIIVPAFLLWIVLALHIWTLPHPYSILDAVLLGPGVVKLSMILLSFLAALGIAYNIDRCSRADWRRQRQLIIGQSEKIARQLEEVAEDTARYGRLSAEMTWFLLIEQKLLDLATEINEPRILGTVNILRPTRQAAPLTEDEGRAFDIALAGRLTRTPLSQWIQVMLDRDSPEPLQTVELSFEADRSGNLHLTSRLGFDAPIVIIRPAP